MVRWAPYLTALAAFLLYVATMAHVHHGDTPVYVQQIQSGELLARSHMLPRPLGALAVAVGRVVAPNAGPYPPLILLNAAAAAASAGLLQAWIGRLTGRQWLAMALAAGFAVSKVAWRMATTFEFPLFPLVPMFAAGLLLASDLHRTRPLATAAGAGGLLAVAFGLHAIAAGAVPAFALLVALEPRPPAQRAAATLALGGAFALGVILIFQVALALWNRGPDTPVLTFLAGFTEPTKDALEGRIQPRWLVVSGLSVALAHGSAGYGLMAVWLGGLVAATWRARQAGWARFGGTLVFPAVWAFGVCLMAMRVEAGDWEYYAEAVAALFLWTGLVAALHPAHAFVTLVGVLVFIVFVGAANLPGVLRAHTSTDGTHRELDGMEVSGGASSEGRTGGGMPRTQPSFSR